MTPSTALKSLGVMIGYFDLAVPEACILPRISSDKVSRLISARSSCMQGEEKSDVQNIRPNFSSGRLDTFNDPFGKFLDMSESRVEDYCDDRFRPVVSVG